jgi:integrase
MRGWNKLSASFVRGATGRGRYSDGGGLYLQITNGGKVWVFQYQRHGRSRSMGLGSTRAVALALARELAAKCREDLARSLDPIDQRKAAALAAKAERAKLSTFKQAAEDYLAANETKWRNQKHRKEWRSSLARYAYPLFGNLAVSAIDPGFVVKALAPLVETKPVTASRLRGRIETVLDFATAAGRRSGDNPAAKAIIAHMLPLRSEKAAVVHQPALPFAKLPAFMRELRQLEGLPARLLELIILSGLRLDAVRPALCGEFDHAAAVPVWVVPAARMKGLARDHRIPLVGRALALAQTLIKDRDGGAPVFGNGKPVGKNSISKSVLPGLLATIGHADPVTTHGFRSCLKDWTHETTSFAHEVVEQALGHRIMSSVERAYRRGDLFERRRALMAAWDRYCGGEPTAEVIELRA